MKKLFGVLVLLIALSPAYSDIKFRGNVSASFITGAAISPEVDFGNFAVGATLGYLFIDSEKSETGPSFGFYLGYTDIPGEKGFYDDIGLEFLYTPISMLKASINLYFKCGYSFNELFRAGIVTRLPIIPNLGEEYDVLKNLGQAFLITLLGIGVEVAFTF
ncbi:MAG: hypothetical protein J6X54_05265 [Treponema sp.]|nr:hypothetical protein [Treponema sp.]